MSYFFTMTVFPVIICLYTLLGNNFELAMRVLDFLGRFVADETASFLQGFIEYVADNYSIAMMVAGRRCSRPTALQGYTKISLKTASVRSRSFAGSVRTYGQTA